jgi:hypothetical protein
MAPEMRQRPYQILEAPADGAGRPGNNRRIKSGSFCLNATRVNDYATITPHHLAALSLSRAADALPSTETDPATWFFIILDLHRALYCALIAALSAGRDWGLSRVAPHRMDKVFRGEQNQSRREAA